MCLSTRGVRCRAFVCGALLLGLADWASATQQVATICTTYGDDMTDKEVADMIQAHIPASAKRLVVLTQCYGGNAASSFAGASNTAVVSATSKGQKARYGGYDDDAAGALKPGAGKTGQTVHDAGVKGKHAAETPSTSGGLAPKDFSLEPVSASGAVRSRHVVVYAGAPDTKPGRDVTQREAIKSNFAGQANTTVRTVGGEGPGAGWDKHGWKRGLNDAIKEAGAAIAAAPDPSKEQFLLFVTDHGDLHTVTTVTTAAPAHAAAHVSNVQSFVTADFDEPVFEAPGFSITVSILGVHPVGAPGGYIPFYQPGRWSLRLEPPPPRPPLDLADYVERFIDCNDDGLIGNAPGEGVRLFFQADPVQFVESFFDVTYDVMIQNHGADDVLVMEFSQDTGPVAKPEGHQVDAPTFKPDGGSFPGSSVSVTVSCATEGATIRYTINGRDPAESSPTLPSGGSVLVPLPGTLKARAWKDYWVPSETKSAAYLPQPEPPGVQAMGNADFDGDGKADPAVFDPDTGAWTARLSSAGYASSVFEALLGSPGWHTAAADFDGDGLADPAVYQETTASWKALLSASGYARLQKSAFLGGPGWTPAPADYDGDRFADVAAYEETSGNWSVALSGRRYATVALPGLLGGPGWMPAAADLDGDGLADPAAYARADGTWKVLLSGSSYTPLTLTGLLGGSGWTPVPGDYDGDRRADPAVRNADGSLWKLRLSSSGYAPISVPLGL